MRWRKRVASWNDFCIVWIVMGLLVLAGLNTVETAFFQLNKIEAPSSLFRVQLPAPGHYHLQIFGHELEISWVIPVEILHDDEEGYCLQVGTWRLNLPAKKCFFLLP
jgi:hypothetical protein